MPSGQKSCKKCMSVFRRTNVGSASGLNYLYVLGDDQNLNYVRTLPVGAAFNGRPVLLACYTPSSDHYGA